MKLNLYDNIQKFFDDHYSILLEKEYLNNLIITNIIYGIDNKINNWLYGNITYENKIQLIFLQRKPWKLLLYSLNEDDSINEKIIEFFAKEIYKIDNNINGINSEEKIAKKFSDEYCSLSNKKQKIKIKMGILVLNKIIPNNLDNSLIFRKAEIKDKNILIKYINDFSVETSGEKKDDEKLEFLFNKYIKYGYYIIEKNGKIVSQAAIGRKLINGKCICSVYTPKEERNKKYSYNLISRLSDYLLNKEKDKFVCLYTDDYNKISNHLYEKIGFERKNNCIEIEFIN